MPERGGDDLRGLHEALAELARADLPAVLSEARAEARARAKSLLSESMTDALLAEARRELGPSDVPARAASPSRAAGSFGFYVYGVVAGGECASLPDVTGVDPAQPLTTVLAGELAALASRVSLVEFDEEPLREHLSDMGWVETVARRHEAVLEAVAASRTVIPMRLCSIYRDEDGVRAMLMREAGPLQESRGRLAGRSEWGVKVFSVEVPSAPAPSETGAAQLTGAEYLQQRREGQRRRASSDELLAGACDTIHAGLSAIAAGALVLPLQRPEVTGQQGEMLFNGAYLVDDGALTRFHESLETLQGELGPLRLALHATGPWPAYNFVSDAIGVSA